MAINFFRVEILKASNGDLPTGLAAYISRSSLRSAVTGERFRHRRRKNDLAFSDVLLPVGADPVFRDPEQLWSAMERAEVRKTPKRSGTGKQTKAEFQALLARVDEPGEKRLSHDQLAPAWRDNAQLAYHVILGCPHEFSESQNIALVTDFVKEVLLPLGLVTQVAVHRPDTSSPRNWHAHLLIGTRYVSGSRIGNKIRDAFAEFSNKAGGTGFVSGSGRWPDRWAAFQLDYSRQLGISIGTPEKAAIPESHQGKSARVQGSDGIAVWTENKIDSRKVIVTPSVLAGLLSELRSTFTEADARTVLQRHGVPAAGQEAQIRALQNSPDLLPLFDCRSGQFAGRFTTRAVRSQELRIRGFVVQLAARKVTHRAHRKLTEATLALMDQLAGTPYEALRPALRELANASAVTVLPIALGSRLHLRSALAKAARKTGVQLIQVTGGRPGQGVISLARVLGRQTPGGKVAWNRQTLVAVHDADLLGADDIEFLLRSVTDTGARLVLVAPPAPRHSMGRSGAYAVFAQAAAFATEPTAGPLGEDGWPVLDLPSPADLRLPSLAFSAPGDQRRPPGKKPTVQPQPHAPRPWRWPGAGLNEIHNLSCAADCELLFTRMTRMPAEDAITVYRTLPKISASAGRPSSHPLATLQRRICGHLRKAGLDPVFGQIDRDCFRHFKPENPGSMARRPDLAPRGGQVDVRPLLATIDSIDLKDWEEITATMQLFCRSAFESIRDSLHDILLRRCGDDVRYAASFVLVQVYLLAKEAGQDMILEVARDDIWSVIPAAERIQRALRYDDHDGTLPLALALSTPSFRRLNPQAAAPRAEGSSALPSAPQPRHNTPDSQPAITDRSGLHLPERHAAIEQPAAMADSQETNSHSPTFGNELVRLCLAFVSASDRSRQLSIAEAIARLPAGPTTDPRLSDLASSAGSAAAYLRTTPRPDPMLLGSYLEVVRARLSKMGVSSPDGPHDLDGESKSLNPQSVSGRAPCESPRELSSHRDTPGRSLQPGGNQRML